MKAIINDVKFLKESESKYGLLYNFRIFYDDKQAYYSCKKREQDKFIIGQEAEFTEEEKEGSNGAYLVIKPIQKVWAGKSGFVKEIKKEQSKYSGFAVSYVKDLIIAGKIDIKNWEPASEKIFNFMVKLDKSIIHD